MSRETSGFRATPARRLLTPGAVSDFVADRYGVVATNCVLLRSLNNDVYRIDGRGASWIQKIYGHDWVTAVDLEWELDLLEHLLVQGIQCPTAVPTSDGSRLDQIEAPEGYRLAVRFQGPAQNQGAVPPSPAVGRAYRRAFAEMYNAADGFGGRASGRPQLMAGLRPWITSEYEHNGLRADGDRTLTYFIALSRGKC